MPSVQTEPSPIPTGRGRPALLHSGDRLDQPTFHRLYEDTPDSFKAELIEGTVYVASPVSPDHSHSHVKVIRWLSEYSEVTPGTDLHLDATFVLGDEDEPQPDATLLLEPGCGGRARAEGNKIVGPPEMAVEVSFSSWSIDLNAKLRTYQRAGVREYLVVDVHDEALHWFVLTDGRFEPIVKGEGGLLRSLTFPGLWIDPSIFFDAKIGRVLAALKLGLASPEHAAFVAKLGAAGDPA